MANNSSEQRKNMQKSQYNLVIRGLAWTLIFTTAVLIIYLVIGLQGKIEIDNRVLALITGIIASIITIFGRAFMHMVKNNWR